MGRTAAVAYPVAVTEPAITAETAMTAEPAMTVGTAGIATAKHRRFLAGDSTGDYWRAIPQVIPGGWNEISTPPCYNKLSRVDKVIE